MKKIVIATGNKGKLREMRTAFSALGIEVLSLKEVPACPEPIEDGETFLENALIKARYYHKMTGLPCVADDSGLEVEALGGAPGVHSARFCGHHGDDAANNEKLVAELKARGLTESPACYRCALVLAGEKELTADGTVAGRVKTTPRGTGGFGYDPYFYMAAPFEGRTMAELTPEEKDSVSHRGEALRALIEKLKHEGDEA